MQDCWLEFVLLSLQDKLERYGPFSTLVRQTLDVSFDTLFCARLVLLDSGLDEIVVIIRATATVSKSIFLVPILE